MLSRIAVVLIVLSCCAVQLFSQQPPDPAEKTVSITISALDPGGELITGIGISIGWADKWPWKGITGDHPLVATITVPTDLEEVRVNVGPAMPSTTQAIRQATIRNTELKESYSFRREYTVRIVGPNEPVLELHAKPAVTIVGRMVDPDGNPISGNVIDRNWWDFTASLPPNEGPFTLRGVAMSEPTEIFFSNDGFETLALPLTAEQTAVDLNLGDIALHPIQGTCSVRLQIDGPSGRLVTLISSDGARILRFLVNTDGTAAASWGGTDGLRLPEGRYYVAPDSLLPGGSALLLLDLIRADKAALHAELPSFEARPDLEASITITALEVRTAISAAAEAELAPE
jgi:hypothetical protein